MSKTNIQSALTTATDRLSDISQTAQLDAEVLLCHVLGKDRCHLRAWPEKTLTEQELANFLNTVELRAQTAPIAYITGRREFWSREFIVSPDVLIPRPDTELLIELSLKLISTNEPIKLIDQGTGSGVIAITLAAERPMSRVIAVDQSAKALEIAHSNAERHQIGNVSFRQSDWFENINDSDFDLVISNPPYIAAEDPHLKQGDVRHEPKNALISADHGLEDIAILARQSLQHLRPGGHLLIEHGYNQGDAVQAIFNQYGYCNIANHTDLSGNPRVTSGTKRP